MINYFYILVTIVLFSTIEVSVKCIEEPISPLLLLFIRIFIAGLILLLLSLGKVKKLRLKDFLYMLFLGFFGVGIALSAFHTSLLYLKASTAAVIFSANPVYSLLAASLILGERFSNKRAVAMLLGIAGTYVISFGFTIPEIETVRGPLLMTVASILFATYITASKKVTVIYGPILPTAVSFLFGSIILLPFIHGFNTLGTLDSVSVGAIIYLSFGATALAYVCYFKGLSKLPVSAGTMLFFMKPPLASVLAMIVLKEHPNMNFFVGFLAIIASISISLSSEK